MCNQRLREKYRFACPFVLIVNIGESVVVAGGHKHNKYNNNISPRSGSSSALLDLPNQSFPPRSDIHRSCYTLKIYIYTIEYIMDGSDISDTWMSDNNIWQENEWKSYMLLERVDISDRSLSSIMCSKYWMCNWNKQQLQLEYTTLHWTASHTYKGGIHENTWIIGKVYKTNIYI